MTAEDMEHQRREIEILKMCQHPNIVKLLDIFENQDYIYIVMEKLEGGDLFEYLEKRKFDVTEKRTKEICHQLAAALYYLHKFGVAHRDLKPENILMALDDNKSDCLIADFGLSRVIGPNESSLEAFGTLSYVAPEVLEAKPYGKEVDIWSLGVITYLLLSGCLPFDDEEDKEVARQTMYCDPDFSFEPWDKRSPEAIDLVKKMLSKNRKKRPSLEEILKHPWFNNFDIRKKRLERAHTKDDSKKFEAFTMTTEKKESD